MLKSTVHSIEYFDCDGAMGTFLSKTFENFHPPFLHIMDSSFSDQSAQDIVIPRVPTWYINTRLMTEGLWA